MARTRLTAAALALDWQEVLRQLEFKDAVVVHAARSLEEIELIHGEPLAGVDSEEGPGARNLCGRAEIDECGPGLHSTVCIGMV